MNRGETERTATRIADEAVQKEMDKLDIQKLQQEVEDLTARLAALENAGKTEPNGAWPKAKRQQAAQLLDKIMTDGRNLSADAAPEIENWFSSVEVTLRMLFEEEIEQFFQLF